MPAAESLYQEILASEPNHADALHFLGLLVQQRGCEAEALELLTRSIEVRPDSAEYWANFAAALGRMKRYEQALAAAEESVRLAPDYAEGHTNRATALQSLGRREAAAAAFRRAIELKPDHAQAHCNLGSLLGSSGNLDEALHHAREAVRLAPRHAEGWFNMGAALRRAACEGRLPDAGEAVSAFRRAVELRPGWPEAHSELGKALSDCGRSEEAIPCFEKAIELRPDHADAHWNLSLALLHAGEWDRGWLEYEWRRHLPQDASHSYRQREFPQPAWGGQPITGRTILVTAEQGLGDTIQFARYVPLLHVQRGAKVVLECQPPLRQLLEGLDGVAAGRVKVIARGEPLPPFECHARLMSLPGAFGTNLQSVPADVPYLHADPRRVEIWKRRLQATGPGFRIGIAWQGSKVYGGDAVRSPPLSTFAPLADCPGVRLVSLQKDFGSEQLDAVRFPVERFADPALDEEAGGAFLDTAAVMASLDLVVTSDTSIAHLAGALGVAAWVALPFAADWRWLGREREDTPWYPTVRLFRQAEPGDWMGVFGRMAAELRARVGAPAPPLAAPASVPLSPGELLDKIGILQIKSERITDPQKLANVRAELEALLAAREAGVPRSAEVEQLADELRAVNEALWAVEDEVRRCERAGNFGERFVALAREVYRHNDRRAALKRQINERLGSPLVEEKHYA